MDPRTPDDEDRLRALGERLKTRETETQAREVGRSRSADGLKYASEFAGAVIVATVIGYFIDRVAGTSPWGLLGGLFLGTASGIYAMVKKAKEGMD